MFSSEFIAYLLSLKFGLLILEFISLFIMFIGMIITYVGLKIIKWIYKRFSQKI